MSWGIVKEERRNGVLMIHVLISCPGLRICTTYTQEGIVRGSGKHRVIFYAAICTTSTNA